MNERRRDISPARLARMVKPSKGLKREAANEYVASSSKDLQKTAIFPSDGGLTGCYTALPVSALRRDF